MHSGIAGRLERAASAALVIAAAWYGAKSVAVGFSHLGGPRTAAPVCAVVGLAAMLLFWADGTRLSQRALLGLRAIVYPALLVAGVYAGIRFKTFLELSYEWPPPALERTDDSLSSLVPDDRLSWALRAAAQSLSAQGHADSSMVIPLDWPFPVGIELHVNATTDSAVMRAVDRSSGRTCRFTIFLTPESIRLREGRGMPIECRRANQEELAEGRGIAIRRAATPVMPATGSGPIAALDGWPQYRRDAAREAASAGRGAGAGSWRRDLDGEIVATPSVAGPVVLLGTHGPGALHAIDARTSRLLWVRYVPNWIQHEAVSDGRTVVVGFGDDRRAFYGQSPAGVSAFDLPTGTLLWSAFEGNAVMTSPVIHGKRVAYVSAAGVLRMRDLRTGADRGRLNLPGGAILAPPALRGDTLVAALDSANVCAVRLDSLSTLWCRKLEGDAFAGSSAPSIIGSRVYASGAVKKAAGRFGMSVGMWRRVKKLVGLVRPGDWIYDGQDVWALDLATGRVEWHSRTYASARDPGGQISGTVVARDDVGVVLLPLAGRMVGFDLRSGRELWTADVGASRGPVTIVGDRVIVARRTGELQAFSLSSGALLCSIATPLVFDQAGPARLGASLVLGSRAGVAIAVPVSALVDCSEEVVRATIR